MKLLSTMFVCLLVLSGCASQAALDQPEEKDLSVLDVGTHREQVILELGAPAHTEEVNGHKVDLFSFVQGYSHSQRATRALAHGVAEVATLGLWSLAGAQIEENFNGTIMGYKVTYDANNIIIKAERLVEKERN